MTIYRLRPKPYFDEYSKTTRPGDWDDPDVLPLPGAFIDRSSTSMVATATRTQALESVSLYLDPSIDIQLTDRIRNGEAGGTIYELDGIPDAPTNPFTGWQPTQEIPLRHASG